MDNLINTYEDEWASVVKGQYHIAVSDNYDNSFAPSSQQIPLSESNSSSSSIPMNEGPKLKLLRNVGSNGRLTGPRLILELS
jgi:hypothetical protein